MATFALNQHRAGIEQVKIPVVVVDKVGVIFFAELAHLLYVFLGLGRRFIALLGLF